LPALDTGLDRRHGVLGIAIEAFVMAGDWIKMRADLFTHPKVVRMSSALKADVLRTVGGLMSAWCLFDAHSEDGRLSGYTTQTLDDHLRWPGFSAAMMGVEWLFSEGDEYLELPRFQSHNGQSAKRRAQDSDRKRDARKTSASDADKKRTREEKRREEKKEQDQKKKQPQAALPKPPEYVQAESWSGFVDMRKRERHPLTVRAAELVLRELEKLRADGNDPNAVLDQSTRNGWRDVFPLKRNGKTSPSDAYVPMPGEV
jgi:hypothetical protein